MGFLCYDEKWKKTVGEKRRNKVLSALTFGVPSALYS